MFSPSNMQTEMSFESENLSMSPGQMMQYNTANNCVSNLFKMELEKRNINNINMCSIMNTSHELLRELVKLMNSNNKEALDQYLELCKDIKDENGLTSLRIAIKLQNEEAVNKILAKYPLNDPTILSFAFAVNNTNIGKSLLKVNGLDVNGVDKCTNAKPLTLAIQNSNSTLVKCLLERDDIDVNSTDNDIYPLLYASYNSNDYLTSLLMDYSKTNINITDEHGNHFFKILCKLGKTTLVTKMLTDKKFNITSLDKKNNVDECFIMCIQNGKIPLDTLKLFTPHLNVDYQDVYKNTHLMYAYLNHNLDIVDMLLTNCKQNLNLYNYSGNTVLMYAIQSDKTLALSLLNYMKKNCTQQEIKQLINNKNKSGDTIIMKSCNDTSLFRTLCEEYQADINTTDTYGITPLILSIKTGNKELFNYLISKPNIDINIPDINGMTPLMYSINFHNTETIALDVYDSLNNNILYYAFQLCNHPDIDINMTNYKGQTAVMIALQRKHDLGPPKLAIDEKKWRSPLPTVGNHELYDTLINILLNKSDVDMNVSDKFGTLLMHACKFNDVSLFNNIIDHPALNINSRNKDGCHILLYIVSKLCDKAKSKDFVFNKNVMDYDMCESFPKFPVSTRCETLSALPKMSTSTYDMRNMSNESYACLNTCNQYGPFEKVVEFAKPSFKTNDTDDNELNQFIYFLQKILNHPELNVNLQDNFGYNALIYANMYRGHTISDILLNHKSINVDQRCFNGYTALMYAVENGLWNSVTSLLHKKANTTIKNNKNETALDIAIHTDNRDKYMYSMNNDVVSPDIDNKQKKGWFF